MNHLDILKQTEAIMAPTNAALKRARTISAAFATPPAITEFNRRAAALAETLTFKKD